MLATPNNEAKIKQWNPLIVLAASSDSDSNHVLLGIGTKPCVNPTENNSSRRQPKKQMIKQATGSNWEIVHIPLVPAIECIDIAGSMDYEKKETTQTHKVCKWKARLNIKTTKRHQLGLDLLG